MLCLTFVSPLWLLLIFLLEFSQCFDNKSICLFTSLRTMLRKNRRGTLILYILTASTYSTFSAGIAIVIFFSFPILIYSLLIVGSFQLLIHTASQALRPSKYFIFFSSPLEGVIPPL